MHLKTRREVTPGFLFQAAGEYVISAWRLNAMQPMTLFPVQYPPITG